MWKLNLTFYIVGVTFWMMSLIFGWAEWRFIKASKIFDGTVTALVPSRSSKGISYKPRVVYVDEAGEKREHTRWFGSNPAGLEIGEKVLIAVNTLRNEVRIASFGHRFGVTALFFALGLASNSMGIIFSVGSRLFQKGSLLFP